MNVLRLSPILLLGTMAQPAFSQEDQAPDCGLYTYKGEVVRVIDADTVIVDVDLGFDVWLRNEHLRLSGINAPENGTAAGEAATEVLRQRIEGESVYLCTMRMKRLDREAQGSFGRYLMELHHEGENLNEWLVGEGYAVRNGD